VLPQAPAAQLLPQFSPGATTEATLRPQKPPAPTSFKRSNQPTWTASKPLTATLPPARPPPPTSTSYTTDNETLLGALGAASLFAPPAGADQSNAPLAPPANMEARPPMFTPNAGFFGGGSSTDASASLASPFVQPLQLAPAASGATPAAPAAPTLFGGMGSSGNAKPSFMELFPTED